MKSKRLMLMFALILSAHFLSAQMEVDSIIEKMRFFDKAVGEWEGNAIALTPEGKITLNQHEKVEFKLNGTILTVEGTGRNELGEITFNAFGILFFDTKENAFKIKAFRDNGQVTLADIEILAPGHFIWSFSPNPSTHIRYSTKFNDTEWHETGEYSGDNKNWIPIFSMSLTKK
jgi:hypothetical protein